MSGKIIDIAGRPVGGDNPAFIMAEAGANHNGEMALAKEMIAAAAEIGCDCIKFQTFTAAEFCADKTKTFTYRSQGKEVTESEFEMFSRLEFSRDEWAELMAECERRGIMFLTTVQDPPNLDMMLELGLKGIKVGSDDFDHLVNLKRYAATGLPLMVSKGMADLCEVDRVVNTLLPLTDKLVVLHCASLYPSEARHLNIRQLPRLIDLYPGAVWGFSDHSPGSLGACIAVSLGARVLEKHFTLDHDLAGPDHWFSLDVEEMAQLVRDVRFTEAALGDGTIRPSQDELRSKPIMRRRVVAGGSLEPGTVLDENTVSFKRADDGAYCTHWELLEGRRLSVAKRKGEGIALADVDFTDAADKE